MTNCVTIDTQTVYARNNKTQYKEDTGKTTPESSIYLQPKIV